jgi:glutamine amidotransferase
MIKIVNYGSGNIQAILNIYKQLNIDCYVAETPEELESATKLILPGVGAFDETMGQLISSGFKDVLDRKVLMEKIPIIGICVGMQILANSSEEGELNGLGYVPGKVVKFNESRFSQKPYIPHLGWNSVLKKKNHKILDNINLDQGFYFLHTFYFKPENDDFVLTETDYGGIFSSSVINNNVFGMQFHPEKSHANGIQLFKNFANL